jgi:hypothetical protein
MAPKFSERIGRKPPRQIQVGGMDHDLRVCLWNVFLRFREDVTFKGRHEERLLRELIWTRYWKRPADQQPETEAGGPGPFWPVVRSWFFHGGTLWFEVYDFLEFCGTLGFEPPIEEDFERLLNRDLESENAGYRFINGQFAPITSESELEEVRVAIDPPATAMEPVSVHIQQALEHLSDKTSPDYRNSIKESISAVESLCKFLANMPTQTLGPALDKVAKELDLNDHVRDGMKAIYKYTSDAHGIRHGLKDHNHPGQEDARFMLVTCSAFVNFVTEKARKQGKLPA